MMAPRPLHEEVDDNWAREVGQSGRETGVPKEVIRDGPGHQKEAFPDPDRLPQAVYPAGLSAWYKRKAEEREQELHKNLRQEQYLAQLRARPAALYPDGASFITGSLSTHTQASSRTSMSARTIVSTKQDISDEKGGNTLGEKTGKPGFLKTRPKKFWILTTLVLTLVLAGILGALLGIFLRRRTQSGSGSVTDTSTSDTLLPNSRLAAANWTDGDGRTRRAVLFQDWNSALTLSLWDSRTGSWTAKNVSALMEKTGHPIKVKKGSPIAATTVGGFGSPYDFAMDVFYLSPDNVVSQVRTTDAKNCGTWTLGGMTVQTSAVGKQRIAKVDSDLAAVTHVCAEEVCPGYTYVAWQDNRACMNIGNSSDWAANKTTLGPRGGGGVVVMDAAAGIALTSIAGTGNGSSGVHGPGAGTGDPGGLSLFWTSTEAELVEATFNVSKVWSLGATLQGPPISREPRPQFAVSAFNNYLEALLVSRQPDGSLLGYRRWANGSWAAGANVTVKGGPGNAKDAVVMANFSSIAMDMDRRFFGTTQDGKIAEYGWSAEDPFTFAYSGVVSLS